MSSNQFVSYEDSVPDNLKGLVADWSSDVQTFKVRWSKAMMWIFLVSDTFIFGTFLFCLYGSEINHNGSLAKHK